MSAPAITPGPWQVEGVRHSGDLKLGPTARLHMVGPDGDAVAAVFYDTKTGVGWHDAKAIAAVPAMIEALQLAIGHECGCGVGTKCQCFSEGSLRIWREEVRDVAAEALKLAGVL